MLQPEITLNNEVYRLARQDERDRAGLLKSARAWQSEVVPKAVHRRPQPNIVKGDMPNEYIATYDDWSQGITGDYDPDHGSVIFANSIDLYTPGAARSLPEPTVIHDFADRHYTPAVIKPLNFNDLIYFARNKGIYRIVNGVVNTVVADIGNYITDMCVYADKLYVAYGTADYIDSVDISDVVVASTQVKARYFAVVEDRLWASVEPNSVMQITSASANPLLSASWGSLITVGTSDRDITSMCGYNERLAVSKTDGLYLGDSAILFPNVLPQVAGMPDANNGSATLVVGSALFYNHKFGIWRYEYGQASEVGLQASINGADPRLGLVTDDITSLVSGSGYLWAGTRATVFPLVDPAYVLTETDGSIDVTAEMLNSRTYGTVLTNSTAYVRAPVNAVIGSQYRGLYVEVTKPANMMSPPLVYGTIDITNTGWHTTTLENDESNYMMESGSYVFSLKEQSSGSVITPNLTTVSGKSGTWAKLVFAVTSGAPKIKCVRWIDTTQSCANVYRGRPRKPGDVKDVSVVWEPVLSIASPLPVRGVSPIYDKPGLSAPGGGLLAITNRYVVLQPLSFNNADFTMAQGNVANQYFITPFYDMGVPQIGKQMLGITLGGRRLDATHTITVSYRADDAATFTSLGVVNTALQTLDFNNLTCKRLQFKFAFTATDDYPTELNSVSLRYRELNSTQTKYVFTIEIADGQANSYGGSLPPMDVQLTNLEALVQTGEYALLDPVGRALTVTVEQAKVLEYMQEALENPVCLVQLTLVEA